MTDMRWRSGSIHRRLDRADAEISRLAGKALLDELMRYPEDIQIRVIRCLKLMGGKASNDEIIAAVADIDRSAAARFAQVLG
jgi:hypothetical protein